MIRSIIPAVFFVELHTRQHLEGCCWPAQLVLQLLMTSSQRLEIGRENPSGLCGEPSWSQGIRIFRTKTTGGIAAFVDEEQTSGLEPSSQPLISVICVRINSTPGMFKHLSDSWERAKHTEHGSYGMLEKNGDQRGRIYEPATITADEG